MPVCSATPLLFISGAPGSGELLVLFVLVLLLFGPRKLPEIARSIGRVVDDLRRASQDFKNQVMSIESSESDAGSLHRALDVSAPDGTHNRTPESTGDEADVCRDEAGSAVDGLMTDEENCSGASEENAVDTDSVCEQDGGSDERSPDVAR